MELFTLLALETLTVKDFDTTLKICDTVRQLFHDQADPAAYHVC